MPNPSPFNTYSKALRCTFFGARKNFCSSKFVQLLLLNRVKARWSENRAAQGFHFINSFILNFFGPNSKTCSYKVRAAWGRVSRGLTVFEFLESVEASVVESKMQFVNWFEPLSFLCIFFHTDPKLKIPFRNCLRQTRPVL